MKITTFSKRITGLSLLLNVCSMWCHAQSNLTNTNVNAIAKMRVQSVKDIRSMLQDGKGNYWFGSDRGGVYRYDGKVLTLFTDKDGLCHNQIRSIQEDRSGYAWFETGNGICRYDGSAFRMLKDVAKTSKSEVWHSKGGDLWFAAGTWKGVYRYSGDSVFNYQFPAAGHDAKLPYDPYDVYCVFEDRAGNIWFGTQSKGVCRYDGKTFTWLNDKGLDGAAVRTIFEDKAGNLWFGNNGYGLFRYDGKTLTNFTEEHGLGNPDFLKSFKEKTGTLARVWSISEDVSGNLWIATIDAGAWRYDGKKLVNYTTKDGLTDIGVTTIYKDRKGQLWFGTAGELCKFNGKAFVKADFE